MRRDIVILGIFVADVTFRTDRLPKLGETLLGHSFALGPGGKGSNQAVAAARAGGAVHFLTRLGRDDFADIARATWDRAGVIAHVIDDPESYTGSACIMVEEKSGDNAIIVAAGAAGRLCAADADANASLIGGAAVFMTQLEQPLPAALRALELARSGGARTILNPAPAARLPKNVLPLCDFVTPNEHEAASLTGLPVTTNAEAERAAAALLDLGAGAVLMTLGENGVFYHDGVRALHVPAFSAGKVVETTGAGDAFNGGFATALAEGADAVEAVRFGCAVAGISVTRPGAAASMPTRAEVLALIGG
ncbi:MAG: ribokinase [Rhodobacteraceae bacterium]|nr:ribokinase [Paracoccaceae bacterium]